MPDELLARKLNGFAVITTNLFSEIPDWLKRYDKRIIEELGELCMEHITDTMPLEQETGTLIVSLRIEIGKPVPTSQAVLSDLQSIMQRSTRGKNDD